MDIPGQSVITVLTYLLPGFITAALVYSLTPSPRPIPFERVVQALIFTMLVQVGVFGVSFALRKFGASGYSLGLWTEQVRVAWSVGLAVALGVACAWAANTDRVHAHLRSWRITCQTSFSSEWYAEFSRNRGYVVLHLVGSRRLLGFPEEWPSTPGQGHFIMANAQWLTDDQAIDLASVSRILVKGEDVEMVEFMKIVTEQEPTDGRQQAIDTTATANDAAKRGASDDATAAVTGETCTATTSAAKEVV